VTGNTGSGNFPTTTGAFQTTYAGGFTDIFVTELDPNGSSLTYSTYLGGGLGEDWAQGITLNTSGTST
jgi:large repetitive protein